VILVDSDYDGVPTHVAPFVLATDGYSVENYACSASSLERFLRYIVGSAASPEGSGGRRRGRAAIDSAAVLDRVLSVAAVVSAVCRVLYLHHDRVGIINGWLRRFSVSSGGEFDCDGRSLLHDSLLACGVKCSTGDAEALRTEQQFVEEDPARRVRGKDFALLLHKLLKAPWGKRQTTVKFATIDESDFTRWLVGQADPTSVDRSPGIIELIARFD
jgi:Protein of unknown function (DUF4435)